MSTAEQDAAVAPPIGVVFALTVVNGSGSQANTMIFPAAKAGSQGSIVVWQSFQLPPGDTNAVTWKYGLNFVRGGLGQFGPGQDYEPLQVVDAVPDESNQITLALVDGELALTDPRPGPPGTLLVVQDSSVPANAGNVGVGISGFGTFVAPAQPGSEQSYGYTPQLCIGTGTFTAGQLMSTMGIDTQTPLNFPAGVTTATATFDGTAWNIAY
ncbi:hypothetical protein [Saccharothrix stipae]